MKSLLAWSLAIVGVVTVVAALPAARDTRSPRIVRAAVQAADGDSTVTGSGSTIAAGVGGPGGGSFGNPGMPGIARTVHAQP